jgi:hypothetical protein
LEYLCREEIEKIRQKGAQNNHFEEADYKKECRIRREDFLTYLLKKQT